jgi:hypothetical protein
VILALYGGAVLMGSLVATGLWVLVMRSVVTRGDFGRQRAAVWYSTASAFIGINLTVVVAFTAQGSGAVMAVFGLAMGLQLVAAINALLFARNG